MKAQFISTNKGEFKVRYIYQKQCPVSGPINVIVLNTAPDRLAEHLFCGPFKGEFGDEIPMTDDCRKEFCVVVITEARKTIDKIKELHDSSRLQFELNCSMILAGKDKSKLRQEVIQEITGETLPATQCTLHKVAEVLQARFNQTSLF